MEPGVIILLAVIALLVFSSLIVLLSRYRKCPSDKILVVYGKIGHNRDGSARSAKCIHGGAAFIVPVLQSYEYLDLTPMSISVDLKNALSKQNIRIDVPSRFTVGISVENGVMQNAAERLLGLKLTEIQELAKDIIFGQLRLVIATMDIEEINTDRDKFLAAVSNNVESELKKIGLRLINVNVTDITDESGYIAALGKEAAAKAINDAKISVAEADRAGDIGEANAKREQRIQVSLADSEAIKGENEARAQVAESDATLKEKQADALRRATAAEKIQAARALQEAYAAEQEAEQIRRKAQGEADAIFAKMEAEARGVQEILTKQAEGFQKIIDAVGGSADDAMKLMIADKLENLVKTQVEAIGKLKIDKVTVWDGMGGKDGTPATANFLSGMFKSVPPMSDLFNMAGMELPKYLGKKTEEPAVSVAPASCPAEEV